MSSHSFMCKYKNQKINVTLEFPMQSDREAEQDFTNRLKEIYLRKIEIGSRQRGEAMWCITAGDKESLGNG